MRTAAFLALAAILLVAVSCTTPVQYQKPLQVYAKAAYYEWQEKSDDDGKETGPVFGAGIEWTVPTIYLRFTGEVYGGPTTLELKGVDGEPESDVTYYGGLGEVDFIYPFAFTDPSGDTLTTVVTPYIGLGYRFDVHDIDGFDEGVDVSVSKATYRTLYAQIGLEGRARMSPTMWFIWDLALGYEIDNQLKVRQIDDDTIEFEPNQKPKAMAEIGFDWQTVFATLFFDYVQWGTDTDESTGATLEKTEQWMLGLRIGWSF
jgi:hypothetical protein